MAQYLNIPNLLTFLRISLVPILVAVLLVKFSGREILAVAIFSMAALTDWLDGYLARKRNQVTALGKLLDPIADKLLISAAFISLVELGRAAAWMVVIIIGREFIVTGLRSIASLQHETIEASALGKTKMIAQVVTIILLILGYQRVGSWFLWAVVILAIVSGVHYYLKFWWKLGPTIKEEMRV